ncbi:MAG: putative 4-hydroxybenzoate polyprenyltransferase [Oligoflexia bacterium]|nr:putative 4-hydroxybenzoate polyprenyltransferase [Oligoflexia bacterium]
MNRAVVKTGWPSEIQSWGRLIKFSHSIFALPFALSMLIILSRAHPITALQLIWILVAVISARTAAMGFNRLHDREIDAQNPRTAARELPSGQISVTSVVVMVILSSLTFLISSAALGLHCLVLAPGVLALLFAYSHMKRLSWGSHLVLGVALSFAPGGVWYAMTGKLSWLPVPLMAGVALWVAGFDIIYACQDLEFDRSQRLHSVPARFGVRAALQMSLAVHIVALLSFALFGILLSCGTAYWLGLSLFGAVMLDQHRKVSAHDLTKADGVFFTRNGAASLIFLAGTLLDRLLS